MGNYRNFELAVYFVAAGTAKAERETLERELAFFERHMRIDKVYIEPYRSGTFASAEQVELCKAVFREHGIKVAGGLTTTMPPPAGGEEKHRLFSTLCYNDPAMTSRLEEVCRFLGEHFDEFIIDDFYFTGCTCDACRAGRDRWNAEHGVTDGSWEGYRLSLMEEVSRRYVIAPAKEANPDISITIKYPNWAESYQETGYNPAGQREIFDMIYTGTETRDPYTSDQHLPRYLSYSLMTYMENMCPGRNGGGWFDPFSMYITEYYLEQAYLTAFSKPKELMMFCFQALADTMNVPALGFQLDRLDALLDHAGAPIGIACYLPDNCQGEDNVQDYLGMAGLPVVCAPYFPENSPSILLTLSSACDPDVVEKLEGYLAKGGRALATAAFMQAIEERGGKRLSSVRFASRSVQSRDFIVEKLSREGEFIYTAGPRVLVYPQGSDAVALPVPEYRNNATWSLIKSVCAQESYGMLLMDHVGKGELCTLAVPYALSDLYRLPAEVLSRLRAQYPVGGVWLEGGAGISLFVYDNDTFIPYMYVDSNARPAVIRLHVAGAAALELPQRGERLEPLYTEKGEAVFEVCIEPGEYDIYRVVR